MLAWSPSTLILIDAAVDFDIDSKLKSTFHRYRRKIYQMLHRTENFQNECVI